MATANKRAARATERELVITRVFDVPRELLFRAWTEREHLVQWSCPDGFTLTHCEGDPRPRVVWRSCMRSARTGDLWLGGVYREIVAPERLVFTHAWDDDAGNPGHATLVTVTLIEDGGKGARGQVAVRTLTLTEQEGQTTLTARSVYPTRAARDAAPQSGMEQGAAETMDRLEAYLQGGGVTAPADTTEGRSCSRASWRRRGSWCSTCGSTLAIWGSGGGRTGSRPLRTRWIRGRAASGDSPCTAPTAPTTRTRLCTLTSRSPSGWCTGTPARKAPKTCGFTRR